MNRRHALCALFSLPLAVQALDMQSITAAAKDPLMGLLTGKLGVNTQQAQGGLGSMLTLAREKLSVADFTKLSNLIPGAANYMTLAKSLGAVSGPLKNLAGLNGSLGKLGMSKETVSKFVPTVSDYLGKAGGSSVQSMLATVFK